MLSRIFAFLKCGLLAIQSAIGQTIICNDENLSPDRPEAWAMQYVAASTLLTAFGETPALTPGRWDIAIELGVVPHLSQTHRLVGFNATKEEDLNKSPVFGRLHFKVDLPARWVAEFGYPPPVAINDSKPHDLLALAIGRRIIERNNWTLSMRAFAQNGKVRGDITCRARLANLLIGFVPSIRRTSTLACLRIASWFIDTRPIVSQVKYRS